MPPFFLLKIALAVLHVSHKTSLTVLKKIGILLSIFSNHNDMKLEINYRRKMRKFTNTVNQHSPEQSKGKFKKNLKTSENGNIANQWNVMRCSTSSSNKEVYSDKYSH